MQIFVCCIDRGAAWENVRFPAVEASYDYTCVYIWIVGTFFNALVWGKCVEYFVLNADYNLRVCSNSVDPPLDLDITYYHARPIALCQLHSLFTNKPN